MRRSPRQTTILTSLFVVLALVLSSCVQWHVYFLSTDAMGGRVPGTSGHTSAGNYAIAYLRAHGVEAADGTTTTSSYRQSSGSSVNIIGQIPGTDLADEIVLIGAHYDHIASCDNQGGSSVCNGATDNAAGAAILLEVAADIFDNGPAPRRTVMFALWDEEESGLRGSRQWVAANPTIVDDIVAYVNYDIQGANLLPSLRNATLAVGAESGGTALTSAVLDAGGSGTLELSQLSVIFGQGRSDHVNFLNESVPTVFFTDATGPCYHTTRDTILVLDQNKLAQQKLIGASLVADLAAATTTPTFTPAPLATYADAQVINQLVLDGLADINRFTPSQQTTLLDIQSDVSTIVAAGPEAFDAPAQTALLLASLDLVNILASGSCDGFLS